MKFTLTLNLGNEEARPEDVAFLLRRVANDVWRVRCEPGRADYAPLLDYNGNTIGSYGFSQDP